MSEWRDIVAQSLDWEEAHTSLEHAVQKLPANLRGKVPENFPHSVWDLVEHIRRTQRDVVEFMTSSSYKELKWPDDYWPAEHSPASDREWSEALSGIRADRSALEKFTTETDLDLTAKIPRGTGQTYLRTILLAVDHASYHIGQIIAARRLLGAWPPK